ncbi:hypothetical protein C8Q76DRAFT_84717 [Earliella scabrosa]|nr:hypothetical protein C8Q76DRAFT_84717 [Earliella scabrosa]
MLPQELASGLIEGHTDSVWILYRRSRKVLLLLAIIYTTIVLTRKVAIVVSVVLLVQALPHATPAPIPPGLHIPGCFSVVPDTFYAPLVIGLITTSTLCLLTLYRTLTFREEFEVPRSPLMTLFLRDGVLYYSCVNVVFLLNLFMIRFATPPYKVLLTGFLDAVPCMLGSRVLINILSLVHGTCGEGATATTTARISEPLFARPRSTVALLESGSLTSSAGTGMTSGSTTSTTADGSVFHSGERPIILSTSRGIEARRQHAAHIPS